MWLTPLCSNFFLEKVGGYNCDSTEIRRQTTVEGVESKANRSCNYRLICYILLYLSCARRISSMKGELI